MSSQFRFPLARLFLWTGIVAVWLAVVLGGRRDEHDMTTALLAGLVLGIFFTWLSLDHRFARPQGANRVEWAVFFVGATLFLAPLLQQALAAVPNMRPRPASTPAPLEHP